MGKVTIKEAKRILKESVAIYLEKDAAGNYRLPQNKQRPLYLEGPAGVGKTELVKQVAGETGIGFVSYSMTHHNRQSAIGLPAIVDRQFEGNDYKATEYTKSEIIAAVMDAIMAGNREGILFLDEVNCVSETLSAAMLQFLQNKTFGPHRIPEGWIIIAAGNPPEYNKSVKVFDAVTLDRLRVIGVEPDSSAWLEYAVKRGMHPIVIQYIRDHGADFYRFEAKGGEQRIVTPRGWEDLSRAVTSHEEHGFGVDDALVGQFIRDDGIVRSFVTYYKTIRKLLTMEEIEMILDGRDDEALRGKLEKFDFQKRWSVMICLYSALQTRTAAAVDRIGELKKRRGELLEESPTGQEKDAFNHDAKELDTILDGLQLQISQVLLFLGKNFGNSKEAELMMNMILDNEKFLKLAAYRRMDVLIELYDRVRGHRKKVDREVKEWSKLISDSPE